MARRLDINGVPPTTLVRLATESDVDVLAAQNGWTHSRTIEKIGRSEFVVAVDPDDTIVGFARLGFLWSELPFLELIVVTDDSKRRQGVGTALLDHLAERFHGTSPFLYSSCNAGEEQPQAWHRHKGFEDCGYLYQVNSPREGEVFFRKPI